MLINHIEALVNVMELVQDLKNVFRLKKRLWILQIPYDSAAANPD